MSRGEQAHHPRIDASCLHSTTGSFISEQGLKGRSWYRHLGTAPGLWKGYGSTTLPAITEALDIDHSAEEAQMEADKLAIMIKGMAEKLRA